MKKWLLACIFVVGCDTAQKPVAAPVEVAQPEPTEVPAAAPVDCLDGAIRELNQMDNRKPVPLQPMMAWHQKQNMMEHLVAIQRINAGLAEGDWDEVMKAIDLIGSSPQMAKMCEHMGSGAEGFTELALSFHAKADLIREPAKNRDVSGTLRATAETVEVCTTCHATYKQEVVDAATWSSRTGSSHQPSHEMHHGH